MAGLKPLCVALGMILGVGSLAPAALAQAIVVRSTGPSSVNYPKGMKLPAGASIKLQAGDVVTVLDKAGSRVLRGAGSFAMDSRVMRDRGIIQLLSRSLSSPQTVRAGAVRSVTTGGAGGADTVDSPIPSSIWLADIDRGGRVCVPKGSDLYLWRSKNGARRFTWLGEADGGGTVLLSWPANTSAIAWPTMTLPLLTGRSYRSNDDGTVDKFVDLTLISLAPDAIPQDPDTLAGLLFERGCAVQFELLANALERASEGGTGG